ncbi:MAG: 4-alpha-glucanotransferase [Acidobacteriota bacterium]
MDQPLRRLAHQLGLLPSYHDALTKQEHVTSDETYRRLLTALGVTSTDDVPAPTTIPFSDRPALPCPRVTERIAAGRAFGLAVNLYSLGGERNWGVGDLGDLRRLGVAAAARGVDFVLLSPLHVTQGRWPAISPYSPISRLFRQPLYIDVDAVPELDEDNDTRAWIESPDIEERLRTLRAAVRVDWNATSALKDEALRRLHRIFVTRHRDHDTGRGDAYRAYRERHGDLLDRFAIFQTLAAHFGTDSWRAWPIEYNDPRQPAVTRWANDHADEVDYHRWLQFELDRQLAAVTTNLREAGMRIGLITDLALGTADGGFDPWAFPGLFVSGVDLGAPPDPLGPDGQNWAFPPLDPRALAADDFHYWRRLLEATVEHAGGIRIDHVLGLIRQFWIPGGELARHGAYMRQPTDQLFAVLAEVCRGAHALAIGEDLGTVPDDMPSTLHRWGVLSTRVLLFEHDGEGRFHPPDRWHDHALATVTTHDLPTLAAIWSGSDLDLRFRLGLYDERGLDDARQDRARTREQLKARLAAEGLLDFHADVSYERLAPAVHAFLARSRAPLVAVWLDDLAGEERPVNLPGVGLERFPSWTRRLAADAVDVLDTPLATQILTATANERLPPG